MSKEIENRPLNYVKQALELCKIGRYLCETGS